MTETRLAVLRNGYAVIPVTSPDHPPHKSLQPGKAGKAPILQGWAQLTIHNTTPALVRSWERNNHQRNTGINCGDVIALDIDVPDNELTNRIVARAETIFGRTPLRRTGLYPKTLLVYRADKVVPSSAWPPKAVKDAPRVEVLGRGKQFVAFGTHPVTLAYYRWTGLTPGDVPAESLPSINSGQVKAFLEAVKALIPVPAETPAVARPAKPSVDVPDGSDFFQRVNGLALERRDDWAEVLFPTASKESGTGAWRVTSKDLGRDLEEDLSIHAEGIRDFGEEKSLSPVDLVLEYEDDVTSARAAALWLCERMHVEPATLGFRPEAAPTPEKPSGEVSGWRDRFSIESMSEAARADPPAWLVRDLIVIATVNLLFGPPGTGKTLVALLLAACIAAGSDFAGRRVRKGPVVYVGAEDPGSIRRRMGALREVIGEVDGLHFLTPKGGVVDIRNEKSDDAVALLEVVRELRPVLIIVDTMPAATPGVDEVEGAAMGAAFAVLSKMAANGAAVLALTHPSKNDPASPRGHTSQLATVATALRLEKQPDGVTVLATLKKARDADPGQTLSFRIETRDLRRDEVPSLDEDGRPLTGALVVALSNEETRAVAARPRLSGAQKVALDALETLHKVQEAGVQDADWRAACYRQQLSLSENPKARHDAITRAIRDLQRKGLVRAQDGAWWPAAATPDDGGDPFAEDGLN